MNPKAYKAIEDLHNAIEKGLFDDQGSPRLPVGLLGGSALKIEDLDVTMKAVTYSWQVGSNCSVGGKHAILVDERQRKRTGHWFRAQFDDGSHRWVHWKRIGFWLHKSS